MSNIVLLQLSGQADCQTSLYAVLARQAFTVLDIQFNTLHQHIHLTLVLDLPEQANIKHSLEPLKTWAQQHALTLQHTAIDTATYTAWQSHQNQPRYVITLLGQKINAAHLAHLNSVLTDNKLVIQHIQRLSALPSLSQATCLELSVTGTADDRLRKDLLTLSQRDNIDIGFQHDDLLRRQRRLIVFDMDSTLIQCEVIDELAKVAGVGKQVFALTEAAMRGEMDFNTSFRRRLATLAGLDASALQHIAATLPISKGAVRLINTLKKLGYTVAILSGGFSYFAQHLKTQLGVDHVFANELDIKNGKLTGKVKGDIINGETKAHLLRTLAKDMGISLQQTIAVGDGANDLPMLNIAGLGIAYHAKPVVQATAKHAISNVGLDGILYFLGMNDREINHLLHTD